MTPLDYLDQYRIRLGDSSKDELKNSSKKNILKKFNSHPYLQSVMINNMATNVIVTQSKKSEDKQLLLMPESKVDIGSNVVIANISYLVMDFQGEGINEIYPSAALKLCNSTYPIKANKTRLLRGHNSLGKPIYEEVYEVDTTTPCIVQMGTDSTNTDAQLVIPRNMMYLTLQYQQSDTLDYNYEFEMYTNKYKIIDIDNTKVINEKGIIKIIAERV
jgi:hypothetical protein